MSTFVFLGPSLALEQARGILDAHYLPPVSQGEVYELVHGKLASRIAIIDGHFSQVPAVWHKELLHALGEGVQVFGAASMGALRAAELERFGMQGVGVIFQAYRDGRYPGFPEEPFEDDDEVALVHGPQELGHRPASESMVNIRSSLNAARAEGVLDDPTHSLLTRLAKARFYPERSLEGLLHDGREKGLCPAMLAHLEQWWRECRVDQKAIDARSLLARLAATPVSAPDVDFRFERTSAFDALARAVERRREQPRNIVLASVLDELRLQPQRYAAAHAAVLGRLLDVEVHAGDDAVSLTARRAQRDLGVDGDGPGSHGYPALSLIAGHVQQQRLMRFVRDVPTSVLDAHLCQQLVAAGEYEELVRRAASKADHLARRRDVPALHSLDDLDLLQLEEWYFGSVLDRWIPDDVNAHALQVGFGSLSRFHRALIAEYVYRQGEPADAV